jgi:superoxide dismutase, Cu-Zn family
MKTFTNFIAVIFLVVLSGVFSCSNRNSIRAEIMSASGSSMTGEAVFEEVTDGVKMTLTVQGATPGTHAVHLHESGDCSAPDATSAGGHWNPGNSDHGNRTAGNEFHSGDIANLEVSEDGTGTLEVTAHDWSIGGDPQTDVIGKAVIIHASADDFISQPSGNAGARVGCGVVKQGSAEE